MYIYRYSYCCYTVKVHIVPCRQELFSSFFNHANISKKWFKFLPLNHIFAQLRNWLWSSLSHPHVDVALSLVTSSQLRLAGVVSFFYFAGVAIHRGEILRGFLQPKYTGVVGFCPRLASLPLRNRGR